MLLAYLVLPVLVATNVLAMWVLLRRGQDGDGSDSDGGGPGRRPPPSPHPPGPTVSWAEFERQFAEHVASLSQDARCGDPRR